MAPPVHLRSLTHTIMAWARQGNGQLVNHKKNDSYDEHSLISQQSLFARLRLRLSLLLAILLCSLVLSVLFLGTPKPQCPAHALPPQMTLGDLPRYHGPVGQSRSICVCLTALLLFLLPCS
jgi:hypothetical protein